MALTKDDNEINSRVQYKYVIESNFQNKAPISNIRRIEENRNKRETSELMKNLKYLTSDQNLIQINATISEDICLFENIKSKLDMCFAQNENCR